MRLPGDADASAPDYEALCNCAELLSSALHETDVLFTAGQSLLSILPPGCVVRLDHILNTATITVTVSPAGKKKDVSCYLPAVDSAVHRAVSWLQPVCSEATHNRSVQFSDWRKMYQEYGLQAFYTVPIANKAAGVGALTIGCSQRANLQRAQQQAATIMAFIVAPYMHIKDVRRSLQIGQTLLLDSLPPQVVSHMMERQSMGMIPVLQPDGHLQYPKSDASSSVASSSVFEYMQPYSHQQHGTGELSNGVGPATYPLQWPSGPVDYANGAIPHRVQAQDSGASTSRLQPPVGGGDSASSAGAFCLQHQDSGASRYHAQPEVSGVGSSAEASSSWLHPQESSASISHLQPEDSGFGPSSSTGSATQCSRHAAHASTSGHQDASTSTALHVVPAVKADLHAATSSSPASLAA
jgi:hypothetical protein